MQKETKELNFKYLMTKEKYGRLMLKLSFKLLRVNGAIRKERARYLTTLAKNEKKNVVHFLFGAWVHFIKVF